MTWWDHETQSIWSQPVGKSLSGELDGFQLELLPMQVTTWGNWRQSHPQSFVLANDLDKVGTRRQGFSPDFVIGVVLQDQEKAYYYSDVESAGIIEDWVGDLPILVWAQSGDYRVYLRLIAGKEVSFTYDGQLFKDTQSGSTWEPALGLALNGSLGGEVLLQLPSLTSYDWAWADFYPNGEIFSP